MMLTAACQPRPVHVDPGRLDPMAIARTLPDAGSETGDPGPSDYSGIATYAAPDRARSARLAPPRVRRRLSRSGVCLPRLCGSWTSRTLTALARKSYTNGAGTHTHTSYLSTTRELTAWRRGADRRELVICALVEPKRTAHLRCTWCADQQLYVPERRIGLESRSQSRACGTTDAACSIRSARRARSTASVGPAFSCTHSPAAFTRHLAEIATSRSSGLVATSTHTAGRNLLLTFDDGGGAPCTVGDESSAGVEGTSSSSQNRLVLGISLTGREINTCGAAVHHRQSLAHPPSYREQRPERMLDEWRVSCDVLASSWWPAQLLRAGGDISRRVLQSSTGRLRYLLTSEPWLTPVRRRLVDPRGLARRLARRCGGCNELALSGAGPVPGWSGRLKVLASRSLPGSTGGMSGRPTVSDRGVD